MDETQVMLRAIMDRLDVESAKNEAFRKEFVEFKQEMTEFKQEMTEFKQDMLSFREENKRDHAEMKKDLEFLKIKVFEHDKEIYLLKED